MRQQLNARAQVGRDRIRFIELLDTSRPHRHADSYGDAGRPLIEQLARQQQGAKQRMQQPQQLEADAVSPGKMHRHNGRICKSHQP